jgi:S-adenosylmethionine:tRNA ribosyltransferase-isomerase
VVEMKTSDFDYDLPSEFIAQTAAEPRDSSRLMVIRRDGGEPEHRHFRDLPSLLRSGDLLVCNNSRVIPARLLGSKVGTGAEIELLLLRRLDQAVWEVLAKPGRRLKVGTTVEVGAGASIQAEIIAKREHGTVVVSFSDEEALESLGAVPLPPYIREPLADAERYQTVYSREKGSVAAPTAGLHFTPELMSRLESMGVGFAFVTLHIALDTFRPVQVEDPLSHVIHREYGEALEHAARSGQGEVRPFADWVDLYIVPGHTFKAVDALITNFHLPRSTLLMLVSAFAGRERILDAYEEAMRRGYRFYSFGDAMLVL